MKRRAISDLLANHLMRYRGNVRQASASLHMTPKDLRDLIHRYRLEEVLREARR